jgi:2,3-bisphosphoglycerate-dependent phosphoglycerate mutase
LRARLGLKVETFAAQDAPMELILIRHGLPERRDDTSDPPLSAEGVDQARRVAERLARERIDLVVSSTMQRAIQTAEPFAALSGRPLHTDPRIVEFDRGAASYVPMEVLKRENYEAWVRFVARGRDGDIAGFQKTVVSALETLVSQNPGRRVAVFCHGGVINVWTAHVLEMTPRLFFEPWYASLHRYLCAGTGERNVVSLNDTAHLQDC